MGVDTSGGHPAMDYKEHNRTYAVFLKAVLLVVAHVAVILILMMVFLT